MTAEASPDPETPLAETTPSLEAQDQQALFQHYRSRERERRQRRRRRVFIAIGALLSGCAALVVALSIGLLVQRREASSGTEASTPPAASLRQTDELRPPLSSVLVASSGAPAANVLAPQPRPPAPPSDGPRRTTVIVGYRSSERLATARPGDSKDRVFDLFGGTVERRNGTLVRIPGMRLRATGRSPDHARVEIAEVEIADTDVRTLYWFLFGDGRLVAWGRPEEWLAAVARYQLDIHDR